MLVKGMYEKCQTVSKMAIPFFIPMSYVREFQWFYILGGICGYQTFVLDYKYNAIPYCGLNLQFHMTNNDEHLSCG